MKLNQGQQEMVDSVLEGGFTSVIAGAGSGKSSTLIQAVKGLVDSGVNPYQVLLLSFTKDSSNDLKTKLSALGTGYSEISLGTIHAICYKILSLQGVNLKTQIPFYEIENTLKKASGNKELDTKDVMGFIGYCQAWGLRPSDRFTEDFQSDLENRFSEMSLGEYINLYSIYEDLKKGKGAYDFGDYLIMVRDMYRSGNRPYTFEYVLLDEAQDNNATALELLDLLCSKENITLVQDFRQSLYSFNGGVPKLALSKIDSKDYKKKRLINMNINYRSTKDIVELSNLIIRPQMKKEYSETVSCNQEIGREISVMPSYDITEEAIKVAQSIKKDIANGIPLEEIMVIYRNNNMVDSLEGQLKKEEIDYVINKQLSFFDRKEISGFLSILRLIKDEHDDVAYSNMFKFRCGIFQFMPNSVASTIEYEASNKGMSYLEASTRISTPKAFQLTNLRNFKSMIDKLRGDYISGTSLVAIVDKIARNINYNAWCTSNSHNEDGAEVLRSSLATLKMIIGTRELPDFLTFAYQPPKKKNMDDKKVVRMMSVFASKGLEAESVYLIGLEDGKFPSNRGDYDEELRVLYVGVSRSKRKLCVSSVGESSFAEIIVDSMEEVYK